MNGVTAMDENGSSDIRSPIRRLGSTRKLLIFNNIRLQLNEQLRCLDIRMESQVSLIQELQDFFRRRGEVELDYSKSLDKLSKSLQLRHKEQKHKREQWPMFSSYACWQQLVNQTKSLSKDHAALSEIYSTHLVARLQSVIEDVQLIYKKCREIGYETHEEILRVLQELHTTMKTYHSYQTECKAAEAKLRTAENQRGKLQQTIPKEKLERSKKYRLIEKEIVKRTSKYRDARLKSLKAKNEYQLCLEASNTTIHKYFVEDLSDLIDCMDLGFHSMVSRALLMHVTADQGRCRALLHNADNLSHTVHSMDSRADKQKFLEQHHGAFMIPKRLDFQVQSITSSSSSSTSAAAAAAAANAAAAAAGEQDETVVDPELQKALHSEMEARLQHLEQLVSNLRTESEEIWKTLETAEINLLEILNTKDYDSSSHFGDSTTQSAKPESLTVKSKADKQEIEEFYITKIREYILGTSRIARLDSKAELLRSALAKDSELHNNGTLMQKVMIPKRKRIGRMNMSGQPKLFGGSLEEYLEATGEEIPLIMRSCIRIINLYGLHHQGIFRVSGSQVEISNFREGFERGEDPLADTTDASDINSVAGVLKLYLRELREPLFPIIYFDHFVQLAQLESKHELVLGIRKFLQSLPRPVIIVIRYLFAFLNHLSEYADENMMDAYNLAICFGPTLMPAPEDKDQVQYQNQVNELIKNLIVYHAELFPRNLGGYVYEKYISSEPFDCDVGDSPTDQVVEDPDSEVYPSEDESDTMEATVQFDFTARSIRELSLRKGDLVLLRKQVSNDWWQGTVKGKDGLIPDKYISLKIKDEDRDKYSDHLKSSSSEESVRKRRPSGNISVNSQLSIFSHNSASTATAGGGSIADQSATTQDNNMSTTNYAKQQQLAKSTQKSTLNREMSEKISLSSTSSVAMAIPTSSNAKLSGDGSGGGGGGVDNFHYDTVDNVKSKYNYHDEPHSFENSMDFLEDVNHFQFEKKPLEPIYAEPSKIPNPNSSSASSSSSVIHPVATSSASATSASAVDTTKTMHFDEYDGVTFRHPININNKQSIDQLDQRKSEETKRTTVPAEPVEYSNININKRSSNQLQINSTDDDKNHHSDTELFKTNESSSGDSGGGGVGDGDGIGGQALRYINSNNIGEQQNGGVQTMRSNRKYHSKSFSLSENRIAAVAAAADKNLFHQNRELWEKRAELQSQQSLTTPRILSRNRIAPDLVMDLPFQAEVDVDGNSIGIGISGINVISGNIQNSHGSLHGLDTTGDDLTSAERFASANQSTLKKNERFSANETTTTPELGIKKEVKLLSIGGSVISEKPKAEVKPQEKKLPHSESVIKANDTNDTNKKSDEILHIVEDSLPKDNLLSTSSSSSSAASTVIVAKSPIPTRNTQKFVNQFADLHLMGGCLNVNDSATTNLTTPIATSSSSSSSSVTVSTQHQQQQQQTFSSFKPQVKVKPQLMKKPLVLPPTTPEMSRKNQPE